MSTPDRYSDEQLMAFADGELPAHEATRIRTAALHDAALAARIVGFSATGRSLGASFASTLAEPVPEHLLQLLQAPSEASAAPKVVPLRKPLLRRAVAAWPLALAASLALALGLSLRLPQTTRPVASAPLLAGLPGDAAQISAALETTPSGELAQISANGRAYELLPTATFRDADGRWCREFTATDLSATQDAYALACRGGSRWQVELATAGSRVAMVQDEGYFAAGSQNAAAAARAPLAASAEKALIAAGWR